jgi:hypothetical protein
VPRSEPGLSEYDGEKLKKDFAEKLAPQKGLKSITLPMV